MKTAIHPPLTPVTAGSNGTAAAMLPNVCKMPGPPAPFVLTPRPNVAKSSLQLAVGTCSPEGTVVYVGGEALADAG